MAVTMTPRTKRIELACAMSSRNAWGRRMVPTDRGGVGLDGGAAARRRSGRPEGAGRGRDGEREAAVATRVDRGAADEAALGAGNEEPVAAHRPRGARLVDHPLGERVGLTDREDGAACRVEQCRAA